MRDSSSPYALSARFRACPVYHKIRFTPVRVKPRHDGWNPDQQRGFIGRLMLCGCVAFSAQAVGKTPQGAYRLRNHAGAASFRRAWDKALECGESYMLDVALERSILGERVPLMRLGQCYGTRFRTTTGWRRKRSMPWIAAPNSIILTPPT